MYCHLVHAKQYSLTPRVQTEKSCQVHDMDHSESLIRMIPMCMYNSQCTHDLVTNMGLEHGSSVQWKKEGV